MRKAGEVVRIAQNLAIVRCPADDPPEIGEQVLDDQLDQVGRVVDVFGPVERPYVAVTPDTDVHLPGLIGSQLYLR